MEKIIANSDRINMREGNRFTCRESRPDKAIQCENDDVVSRSTRIDKGGSTSQHSMTCERLIRANLVVVSRSSCSQKVMQDGRSSALNTK